MRARLFQLDAFTERRFAGNRTLASAAVILERLEPDRD